MPPDILSTSLRLAVSYQRVSSGKQAGEDRSGLDRQALAFSTFCQRHNLNPAPDALVDAGVSAFRGTHRRKGALAAFIAAAEEGTIPAQTVLVVEDLDRFSREAASHAQGLILRLFDAGLALGIVRDGVVMDRALYDADLGKRVMLTVRQDAANDHSKKLSERISAHWQHKREQSIQGQKIKGYRPFWCDWNGEDYVLNDHAETVRRIAQLCCEGFGFNRIAQIVNNEGLRTGSGKPFSYAYVRKIIDDRSIIGERQWATRGGDRPVEPIPDYFPPVITRSEFDRCHQLIAQRKGRRGGIGKGSHIRNLFQGYIYCPCGRLLTYQSARNRSGETRSYAYLLCLGKRDGLCKQPNVKYDEELILRGLMSQKWHLFFRATDRRAEIKDIRQVIADVEVQQASHQAAAERGRAQLRQLMDQGDLTATAANLVGEQVELAQAASREAAGQLEQLQHQLTAIGQQPTGRELEQHIRRQLREFIAGDFNDPATRQKFNAWLLSVGVRITAVDPRRNTWSFSLDGITRAEVITYRSPRGVIVDDTIDQMHGLGFTQEAIAQRRQQIALDAVGAPQDEMAWRPELAPEPDS